MMLHGTSLASIVTLLDLTGAAREMNSRYYLPFEAFITAARSISRSLSCWSRCFILLSGAGSRTCGRAPDLTGHSMQKLRVEDLHKRYGGNEC